MTSELATVQNLGALTTEQKSQLANLIGVDGTKLERLLKSNPSAVIKKMNLLKNAGSEGGTLDVYTFPVVKPTKEGFLDFIWNERDNEAEPGKKTVKSSKFNTTRRFFKVSIDGKKKYISHRFVGFSGDPIEMKLTARMGAGKDQVDVLEGENPWTRCQSIRSVQFGATKNDPYPLDPSVISWDHFTFKKDSDKNTILVERDEDGKITGEIVLKSEDFADAKSLSEAIRLGERAVNHGKVFTEFGVQLFGRPDPVWAKRMGQDEGIRSCETCLANSWFQERDKKGAWNRCGIEGSAFFLVRELLMPHPISADDLDEITHSWVKVEDLHQYGVEGINGPFVVMIQISNSNFKSTEGIGEKGYRAVPNEMVPMPNKYAKSPAQYWRDIQKFDPNRFDPFAEIEDGHALPNFLAAPTIIQLAKRTDTELGTGYVIVASKDEHEGIQSEAVQRAMHANVTYLWEKSLSAGNEKPEDRPKFETEFYHADENKVQKEETAIEGVETVNQEELEDFLDDDDEDNVAVTVNPKVVAAIEEDDDEEDTDLYEVLITGSAAKKAAANNGTAV